MQFLKSKAALGGLAGIVALSVAGTTAGYAAMNKDISLTLDGKQQEVTVTGDTVREALAAEGIEIGEHDRVAPGLDEEVSDGTAITVRFGRPFNVEVDGDERTYWVTATTVDGALDEIGRAFSGADLSTSRSATVSRDGADLEVITPKQVQVKVGARKPVKRDIVALTVGDVLDEMGVKVHRTDEVKPGLKSEVSDGDKIVFTDIRLVDKRVEAESIDFGTVEREDADMLEGETEVAREGRAGVRDVTYRMRYVNGKLELTRVLRSEVVREPVDRVVTVGTKEPAPEPAPEPAAPAANYASGGTVWDSLAQCESGGNWAINTGNGYYGGLQFSLSTWQAYGGPGYPHQQSRETQIMIAERLRAATGGYGSWPACSQSLGLPQ